MNGMVKCDASYMMDLKPKGDVLVVSTTVEAGDIMHPGGY